jgi:hypothetical protein
MAMRETVRSLKAYFVLSALLSGGMNIWALFRGESGVGTVICLVAVGFAVAYLYVGLRLRQLLATSPDQITKLLIAGAVFMALVFGLHLVFGMAAGMLPVVIISLLITWYLFVNVRRLAAESKPSTTTMAG